MKYYSEKTKQMYDTEEALRTAETDFDIEIAERKKKREAAELARKLEAEKERRERAEYEKQREARFKEMNDAYNHYMDLAKKYAHDFNDGTIIDKFLEMLLETI